jgi:hypothetical protein
MSPIRFEYPLESWSHRELRTRGHVERAADIQHRAQSQVRGWSDEHDGAGDKPVDRRREE